MVLGDNIFAGHGLKKRLKAAVENAESVEKAQQYLVTMLMILKDLVSLNLTKKVRLFL